MIQEPNEYAHKSAVPTPLISILIATRNRQPYAAKSIIDILSWAPPELELIVEDNSDEDTLCELLGSHAQNPILHFHFNPQTISSTENFNAALQRANGIYVCLIGDDDGLNSKIFSITNWARQHDLDCLVGSVGHEYIWPTGKPNTRSSAGVLTFPQFTAQAAVLDTSQSIRKLLKQGCTRYLELPFPRLYHGIVKRSLLENQRQRTGYYIGGLSPDIYAATSLAMLAGRVVKIDYPLTIPGVCPSSTTATEGKSKTASKDIYDAPHFRGRVGYKVDPIIPPFYCADTMWAESALAALKDLNQLDLVKSFNLNALCASMATSNSTLTRSVICWRFDRDDSAGFRRLGIALDLVIQCFRGPFISIVRRAYRKLLGRYFGSRMNAQESLLNIGAARIFLETELAARGVDPLRTLRAMSSPSVKKRID